MARCSPSSSPRSLLGPASIGPHLHDVRPGVGSSSRGLAAHCGLRARLGIAAFWKKAALGTVGTSTKRPALRHAGCGSGDSGCSSGEDRSFWANLLSMIRQSGPDPFARPDCRGCGVGPDRQRANRTMDGRRRMGLCRRGGGGHTGLCLRRGRSPTHGGTRHDGRGNWSRLYLHASLRRHLPANSNDASIA